MSGPEIFLTRINEELSRFNLTKFKIFIPFTNEVKKIKSFKGIKIARLDGAIYYRFNSKSFRNFIIQKTGQDYKVLALIPDFFFNIFGSSIRNYLNRNNKKLLKYSDVIVFQSKMSKAMHEYFWGKINKKNLIIYNGIKSREYSKKTINKEINLVITASFRLNKRLSDAILITNSLNLKNYSVKLHVIGKLDFLTIESIAHLDKSNSIFHGHLNFKSIQKIYTKMHIGLSTSMFDPCPNSVIEMMSFGIPTLTTSESGAAELVGLEDLIVNEKIKFKNYNLHSIESIPRLNIDEWNQKIYSVISNYEELSYKTYTRFIGNFNIEIIANKYKSIIDS